VHGRLRHWTVVAHLPEGFADHEDEDRQIIRDWFRTTAEREHRPLRHRSCPKYGVERDRGRDRRRVDVPRAARPGLRPGTRLLLQQAAQRRAAHDLATRVPLGAEERRFQLEAKPKTKRHASWQARESSTQLTPWTFIP